MRKLVYLVGGKEVTSYSEAREIQPTGELKTRLDTIVEEVKVNPERYAKVQAYFAKKRAEKAVAANAQGDKGESPFPHGEKKFFKNLLTRAKKHGIINLSNEREVIT